jgi:hypothetical protein
MLMLRYRGTRRENDRGATVCEAAPEHIPTISSAREHLRYCHRPSLGLRGSRDTHLIEPKALRVLLCLLENTTGWFASRTCSMFCGKIFS